MRAIRPKSWALQRALQVVSSWVFRGWIVVVALARAVLRPDAMICCDISPRVGRCDDG